VFKDRFITVCRANHLGLNTEKTYWFHVKKFILWTGAKSASDLENDPTGKFRAYLSGMANENPIREVGNEGYSASYQNQAFHAIRFMYEKVLNVRLGDLSNIPRATRFGRMVDVPDDGTAAAIVGAVNGQCGLALRLIYGTAGRLNDILRLRVKDLDFGRKLVAIQESKGGKSRLVPMPESLIPELKSLVRQRDRTHQADIANGFGWIGLPGMLAKKYPKEQFSLGWQYVFASGDLSKDPVTGNTGRWHLQPVTLQKAFQRAREGCGIRRHFNYVSTAKPLWLSGSKHS